MKNLKRKSDALGQVQAIEVSSVTLEQRGEALLINKTFRGREEETFSAFCSSNLDHCKYSPRFFLEIKD